MTAPLSSSLRQLLDNGWRPIRPGAFVDLIGPFLTRDEGGAPAFCFVVEDKHDNTQARAHGGMILAFCDEAMGLTARATRPHDRMVTVSFDCQLVDGALPGEIVSIRGEIVRSAASLIFVRAVCMAETRPVANCSGIWKVVRNAAAQAEGPSHA